MTRSHCGVSAAARLRTVAGTYQPKHSHRPLSEPGHPLAQHFLPGRFRQFMFKKTTQSPTRCHSPSASVQFARRYWVLGSRMVLKAAHVTLKPGEGLLSWPQNRKCLDHHGTVIPVLPCMISRTSSIVSGMAHLHYHIFFYRLGLTRLGIFSSAQCHILISGVSQMEPTHTVVPRRGKPMVWL